MFGSRKVSCRLRRQLADGDEGKPPKSRRLVASFPSQPSGPAVVPRKPKLIAAAAVLAVGLGLAWPWRRGETVPATVLPIATPSTSFGSVPPPPATPASVPAAATPVSATTIGLSSSPMLPGTSSVGSTPQMVTVARPLLEEPNRSAPLPLEGSTAASTPSERTYIVQNGDSLERLAQRYLGDEARAIEIFDLNRQVLENPHILPLGTELKIPLHDDSDVAPVAP